MAALLTIGYFTRAASPVDLEISDGNVITREERSGQQVVVKVHHLRENFLVGSPCLPLGNLGITEEGGNKTQSLERRQIARANRSASNDAWLRLFVILSFNPPVLAGLE